MTFRFSEKSDREVMNEYSAIFEDHDLLQKTMKLKDKELKTLKQKNNLLRAENQEMFLTLKRIQCILRLSPNDGLDDNTARQILDLTKIHN